ncbi:F0F1 ATP synthase subunit I [Shewanella intestini]|uniref:F0F1 ATP synthase subunit I n=2 Tax=Shewanellaceae TaxID=267890 RepID=A0ABS5I4C3_9GAMM|nr:F0F1 ATP synthase subunit I [Shewanella intestini]
MIQFIVVCAVAISLGLVIDYQSGFSALIGGGICFIANSIFAFCVFSAKTAEGILMSFYLGQALKILVTIILFIATYVCLQVEFTPLKLTYLIVLGVSVFAPLLLVNYKK